MGEESQTAEGHGIRARSARDTVSVTGSAKQRIVSDFVGWNGSVSAQGTLPGVAARQLETWASRVRAFLLEAGVHPDELTVSPISIEPVTRTDQAGNEQVTGYSLTRSFAVRSPRVDAIVAVIQSISELALTGIPLTASPPEYTYTRLAETTRVKDVTAVVNVTFEIT